MKSFLKICVLLSLIFDDFRVLCSKSLETVNDEDLLNLIRSETYISILFTKKDCPKCDEYEDVLYRIREELVDDLNAWVVKAVNSQLVRIYNPLKEPSIVFFRHGVPLLYNGEPDDELVLHTFRENKDPCVRELNDENFEHLTQVSTGATTGDWFVLFYSTDCVDCQYLQARWESVCAQLKTRLNIARINKQTTGKIIGRRFEVSKVPSFIFYRHGKMYRYTSNQLDVSALSSFPVHGYKKARAETVTAPKTPMEDMILGVMEFFLEFSFLFKLLSLFVGVSVILSVAYKIMDKEKKTTKKHSKNK